MDSVRKPVTKLRPIDLPKGTTTSPLKFILLCSVILNAILAIGLFVAWSMIKPTPDVSKAYSLGFDTAKEKCQSQSNPSVDCENIRLLDIRLQEDEQSRWIMNFASDNKDTMTRWQSNITLKYKGELINADSSITHCAKNDDLICQVN